MTKNSLTIVTDVRKTSKNNRLKSMRDVILQEVHCKIKDERKGSEIRNLKKFICP